MFCFVLFDTFTVVLLCMCRSGLYIEFLFIVFAWCFMGPVCFVFVCRKAIAKSGLQHLSCQPCAAVFAKGETDREIRSTVDWSVSNTNPNNLDFRSLFIVLLLELQFLSLVSHLIWFFVFEQESALYGEHIWFETNVSGDFCYVGEQHCYAKSLVSVCFIGMSVYVPL